MNPSRSHFILAAVTATITLAWNTAHSTNYYLSEKGNDNYSGTSKDRPWRTLKKFNEFIPVAKIGDSVFFDRGSQFKGQLNISCSGLYIGAYGSGNRPIISGSLELENNWVQIKKNIWKAYCADCAFEPDNLFIDEKLQPLGRYPNQGYLAISNYSSIANVIHDNSMSAPNNYWNQAEIVVKSSRWSIDKIRITEYKNKSFYISSKPSYDLQAGSGYFIQKHLSALDQHGEWFFESKTKQVYIYLSPGFAFGQHHISVSAIERGLIAKNASTLVIENLIFDKYQVSGAQLNSCDNAKLTNIEISNSGVNGLEIIHCKSPIVENSRIINSNNNGVEWQDNSGGRFSHNIISRTGLYAGRGASGNGAYIALYLTSSIKSSEGVLIERNTIDSVGYSGIDFRTTLTNIKNNRISNFCMTKDDGAGIYTWGNAKADCIIEQNTIQNGIGSGEGTINKEDLYASGIYIDDLSSNINIKNNSISNCSLAGIFLHNSSFIKLNKNTLYANGYAINNTEKGQLYIKMGDNAKKEIVTPYFEVVQNKLIATHESSFCLFYSAKKKEDLQQIGSFRKNEFVTTLACRAVAVTYNQPDFCAGPEELTLKEWQQISLNEREAKLKITLKHSYATVGSNLIDEGIPAGNLEGWMSWPAGAVIVKEKNASGDYDLKINISKEIKEALLYHRGISLKRGKIYRLTFTAKSEKSTKIQFAPLMANSPWAGLGKYSCFSTGSTYRTYTYYFTCFENSIEARVNFKSNSTFYIANVTLFEVKPLVVKNEIDFSKAGITLE